MTGPGEGGQRGDTGTGRKHAVVPGAWTCRPPAVDSAPGGGPEDALCTTSASTSSGAGTSTSHSTSTSTSTST
ncbi:hypothetical protein, partial [Streptomyces sp. SID161]|uniref:hypothetical protein n=1 Tax=Streptomyces sp. SID161 TaxID=2690251 RepID=UPI001F479FF2